MLHHGRHCFSSGQEDLKFEATRSDVFFGRLSVSVAHAAHAHAVRLQPRRGCRSGNITLQAPFQKRRSSRTLPLHAKRRRIASCCQDADGLEDSINPKMERMSLVQVQVQSLMLVRVLTVLGTRLQEVLSEQDGRTSARLGNCPFSSIC